MQNLNEQQNQIQQQTPLLPGKKGYEKQLENQQQIEQGNLVQNNQNQQVSKDDDNEEVKYDQNNNPVLPPNGNSSEETKEEEKKPKTRFQKFLEECEKLKKEIQDQKNDEDEAIAKLEAKISNLTNEKDKKKEKQNTLEELKKTQKKKNKENQTSFKKKIKELQGKYQKNYRDELPEFKLPFNPEEDAGTLAKIGSKVANAFSLPFTAAYNGYKAIESVDRTSKYNDKIQDEINKLNDQVGEKYNPESITFKKFRQLLSGLTVIYDNAISQKIGEWLKKFITEENLKALVEKTPAGLGSVLAPLVVWIMTVKACPKEDIDKALTEYLKKLEDKTKKIEAEAQKVAQEKEDKLNQIKVRTNQDQVNPQDQQQKPDLNQNNQQQNPQQINNQNQMQQQNLNPQDSQGHEGLNSPINQQPHNAENTFQQAKNLGKQIVNPPNDDYQQNPQNNYHQQNLNRQDSQNQQDFNEQNNNSQGVGKFSNKILQENNNNEKQMQGIND